MSALTSSAQYPRLQGLTGLSEYTHGAEFVHELAFSWPAIAPGTPNQEFFVGAWHPTATLSIAVEERVSGPAPVMRRGRNWLLLSSTPLFGGGGLIHVPESGDSAAIGALAFRGYLTSPVLHTRSTSARLLEYWGSQPAVERNGVFAAAAISADQQRLTLTTDAFGISPLYWTELPSGVVLFATSQRYLRTSAGDLDPIAARSIMTRGALFGDMSLVPGVRRVPAGGTVNLDARGASRSRWFSFDDLPPGEEPLTDSLLRDVEQAFQDSMDRCLAVAADYSVVLPLSSGDDSRRIMASMLDRKASFEAVTVRILQKGNRDMDAVFAAEMARTLGFDHRVVEHATPDVFADDDETCRTLFGGEVSDHSWIAPLVRGLPATPAALFDGLAGDVLGNTGYRLDWMYAIPNAVQEERFLELALPDSVSPVLRPDLWGSSVDVRQRLRAELAFLPRTANWNELAYLMVRTRRGTAPWGQDLVPAGHLMLYPYFDLGFVRAAQRAVPTAKVEQTLQSRCLERFWPKIYAMKGSQRNSDVAPQAGADVIERLMLARLARMRQQLRARGRLPRLHAALQRRYAMFEIASRTSDRVALRVRWWLDPLLMLEVERAVATPVWRERE